MLLDSNIIIYAAQPEHGALRQFIQERESYISVVSYVEVLGYHLIGDAEKGLFELFFQEASLLDVTQKVVLCATRLRQKQRMSLGDALIAATALENGLVLVTRNVDDFSWIDGLEVINPLD